MKLMQSLLTIFGNSAFALIFVTAFSVVQAEMLLLHLAKLLLQPHHYWRKSKW